MEESKRKETSKEEKNDKAVRRSARRSTGDKHRDTGKEKTTEDDKSPVKVLLIIPIGISCIYQSAHATEKDFAACMNDDF